MKAAILFLIGVSLIVGGYKTLPTAGDTNSFTIAGINKKTIAISLFVVAGLLIIWGLFSIKWNT